MNIDGLDDPPVSHWDHVESRRVATGGVDAPPVDGAQETETKPAAASIRRPRQTDKQADAAQFCKMLKRLGHSSETGGHVLCISTSQVYRYASGKYAIPPVFLKLLRALVKLGTTEV